MALSRAPMVAEPDPLSLAHTPQRLHLVATGTDDPSGDRRERSMAGRQLVEPVRQWLAQRALHRQMSEIRGRIEELVDLVDRAAMRTGGRSIREPDAAGISDADRVLGPELRRFEGSLKGGAAVRDYLRDPQITEAERERAGRWIMTEADSGDSRAVQGAVILWSYRRYAAAVADALWAVARERGVWADVSSGTQAPRLLVVGKKGRVRRRRLLRTRRAAYRRAA